MANTAEQNQVIGANTVEQNQAVGAVAELLRLLVQREEQAEERRRQEEERRHGEDDKHRRAEEERCQHKEECHRIEVAERERMEAVLAEKRREQRHILEMLKHPWPVSTEGRLQSSPN